jgi:hypothetical protein
MSLPNLLPMSLHRTADEPVAPEPRPPAAATRGRWYRGDIKIDPGQWDASCGFATRTPKPVSGPPRGVERGFTYCGQVAWLRRLEVPEADARRRHRLVATTPAARPVNAYVPRTCI